MDHRFDMLKNHFGIFSECSPWVKITKKNDLGIELQA